jgi:hypothetical protein
MSIKVHFGGEKTVIAYRGKKRVYDAQFSASARISDLVKTWRRNGCRVVVTQMSRRTYSPLGKAKT